jgi:hypothetical protein
MWNLKHGFERINSIQQITLTMKKNIGKKVAVSLLALVMQSVTVSAQAAVNIYFDHTYDYTFVRNDPPKDVGPILLIDQGGQGIKAQYGINILIPEGLYTLWDKNVKEVHLTGSAVEKGKMEAKVMPVYSPDLKQVFIPVKADFAKDEQVSIAGLMMRIYKIGNSKRYLQLDVNGDKAVDVNDFRSISISDTDLRTDGTTPYPVENLQGVYAGGKVALTWKDPVDLDLDRIILEKKVTRDAKELVKSFEFYPKDEKFTDDDVKDGEMITYKVTARDSNGNVSESLITSVKAELPKVEQPVQQPTVPVVEIPVVPPQQSMSESGDKNLQKDSTQGESGKTPVLEEMPTREEEEEFLKKFPEVSKDHWAVSALTYLTVVRPVFSGYVDGTLGINKEITRAEIAKIAWKTFQGVQDPENNNTETFKDVKKDDWFHPYIEALEDMGVITGYGDGTFAPNKKMNRAEVLKVLLEAAGAEIDELAIEDQKKFKDIDQAAWYAKYFQFAYQNGIIKGYEDGSMRPEKTATRAEVAVIMMNIREYIKK